MVYRGVDDSSDSVGSFSIQTCQNEMNRALFLFPAPASDEQLASDQY